MTDTTHPIDAAIAAMETISRGDLGDLNGRVDHQRLRGFVRKALPALTAYREGMRESIPAPTREEAIESMARAIFEGDEIEWENLTVFRKRDCKDYATAAYDALLAMGAIREPTSLRKVQRTPDVSSVDAS